MGREDSNFYISKTSNDLQDHIKYINFAKSFQQVGDFSPVSRLDISVIHQARSERTVSNLESYDCSSPKTPP